MRLAGRVRDGLDAGHVVMTAGAGCGKTTVLDEALAEAPRPVARISCTDAERAPGVLLIRIVDEIAAAAPGASDALRERLAAAREQVDPLAATQELLAELSRLLVEPLVLVVDDAEHLDGADGSLRLLDELIRAELPLLRVAVASRRTLELRIAKPRADGRLSELTAADLAFDAQECAALLQMRTGLDASPEQVDEVMEATEGWPLGIALAAGRVQRDEGHGDRVAGLADLSSRPDLHAYLSEELVDSLDPELREAAIDSSITRVVTPAVSRALDLPPDFENRVEQGGLLLRRVGDGNGFVYHPLLREFLLERLRAQRSEDERRRLHAAVAPAMAESGDAVASIEHWLQAQSWPEAVAAIESDGRALVRTSPELVRRWLSLLPDDARAMPTMRALEGQLEWLSGNNERAIPALREAVAGFRRQPDARAEWVARSILVDSAFVTGGIAELEGVVEGWDQPGAAAAGSLAPAAAMYASVAFAAFGRFGDSKRLAAAVKQRTRPEVLAPFEALRLYLYETPRGRLEEVAAGLEEAARALERFDPLIRRFILGALAVTLADRGHPGQALGMWIELRDRARLVLPRLADSTHAWCALLHAQAGRLADAEAELAQHPRKGTGYRAYIADVARAYVASLRGDAEGTVAAADRARDFIAGGPVLFRYSAAADLVPPLAAVGGRDRAHTILAEGLALIDEHYPGQLGCFPRGRLLALRCWLRYLDGHPAGADRDLLAFWSEAGESRRYILRRDWERLKPMIWSALERGLLEPVPTVDAIEGAFPQEPELIPLLDHPVAAVRKAALEPALRSGQPASLERLQRLEKDPDPDLAGAASRAVGRLATSLPPLRFELLGGFAVRRGSWQVDEGGWGRPVDARLVRFLLAHLDEHVSEDLIFEALWPGLTPSSARRSLHVAVSRARAILDPPGAEGSVIEAVDRSYRMALGERDRVDAEEFQAAAKAAVSERSDGRRKLLDRAHSLWGGEPLIEERYSDWAAAYRERLIDRYIEVLTALVEVHERGGDHTHAVDVARELVDLDPLNEGGHQALMTAYARGGRRGHALRQYLECRRSLVEQLGVEPAEEITRLQARILAGETV
jgi:DNA-binding SARP family transcriptional activator